METIKLTTRLSAEERETILNYDNINKKWIMDTTVPKHANKAKKQGWRQVKEYVYNDGTVVGGVFEAPEGAISLRNPSKKRIMSEKQLNNLFGRGKKDEE